jgi:hypothetical protein
MIDVESLSPQQKQLAIAIGDTAVKAGIDPDFAIAQAYAETNLRHYLDESQVKKKGVNYTVDENGNYVIASPKTKYGQAIGLMQILPDTAKRYGYDQKDLLNPVKNVEVYTKIMADHLKKYGALDLAAMAYHQGEDPVDNYLKDNNLKHIGPMGKEYIKEIGKHYDFEGGAEEPKTEAEKIMEAGGIPAQEPPKPEEPSMVPDWAKPAMDFVTQHPTMASIGAAPFTYKAQKSMNREARKDIRSQEQARQNAAVLEQQFKLQQQQPQMQQPPNTDRILQGTMEEGLTGRQRQNYNEITSARAAQAKQQEKVLADLARQGIIAPEFKSKIFSEGVPTGSTPSGIMIPREVQEQIFREQQEAEQKRLMEEALRRQSPVQRAINAANTTKRLIGGGLSNVGRSPLMTGAGTAMAGVYADQASEREQSGDELGAAISRVKALTSGVAGIPIPPRYRPAMVVKGVGGLGTVGLELLDEWRMRNFPTKSVVKP